MKISKKAKLGDLISILTDYHANGSYKLLKKNVELLDDPSYAVMIRTTNFEQCDFEGNKYINEHAYNFLKKSKVYPNDILMNKIANAGSIYLMPDLKKPVSLGMNLFLIRVNSEIADQKYVYYYLKANEKYIKLFATGAATSTITKEMVRRINVRLPNIATQKNIAVIISNYNDLIDTNRRRIQLLEESARLLFREWFVYFRFPGHEKVKIVDGVPEGWENSTIADVCTSFKDGDWIESKDQGGEDFRLLQISNIGDNKLVETGSFRYITAEAFRNLSCNEVVQGDILISRMPKPIGRAWYVYEQPWRMVTAVDVTIARPDPEIVDPFYYLYHLNSLTHIERCELRATGATRPRVSRKNMGALPILRPPMLLQRNFGETASAINAQRNVLTRQNQKLAQARDLLLPRLMSGVIEI